MTDAVRDPDDWLDKLIRQTVDRITVPGQDDPSAAARYLAEAERRARVAARRRVVLLIAGLLVTVVGVAIITWQLTPDVQPTPPPTRPVGESTGPADDGHTSPDKPIEVASLDIKVGGLEVRGGGRFDVYGHDPYEVTASAPPGRPHGWCYTVHRRGAQLLFRLEPDASGRPSGRYGGDKFDVAAKAEYEYFVLIQADRPIPALSRDTGTGVTDWLTAEETDALQKVGTPGKVPDAAVRVLAAALRRLDPDARFDIQGVCYLHHPFTRR